jgi:hypothetical protein
MRIVAPGAQELEPQKTHVMRLGCARACACVHACMHGACAHVRACVHACVHGACARACACMVVHGTCVRACERASMRAYERESRSVGDMLHLVECSAPPHAGARVYRL